MVAGFDGEVCLLLLHVSIIHFPKQVRPSLVEVCVRRRSSSFDAYRALFSRAGEAGRKMNILKQNGDYRGSLGPFSLHLNKGEALAIFEPRHDRTPLSVESFRNVYRVPI